MNAYAWAGAHLIYQYKRVSNQVTAECLANVHDGRHNA
jgi:hypothetical protein